MHSQKNELVNLAHTSYSLLISSDRSLLTEWKQAFLCARWHKLHLHEEAFVLRLNPVILHRQVGGADVRQWRVCLWLKSAPLFLVDCHEQALNTSIIGS